MYIVVCLGIQAKDTSSVRAEIMQLPGQKSITANCSGYSCVSSFMWIWEISAGSLNLYRMVSFSLTIFDFYQAAKNHSHASFDSKRKKKTTQCVPIYFLTLTVLFCADHFSTNIDFCFSGSGEQHLVCMWFVPTENYYQFNQSEKQIQHICQMPLKKIYGKISIGRIQWLGCL